jgi:uncharacterized protein with PQ loop repeat
MELIGWIGSTLLALCGVPLAWQTIKQKHARYMSNMFLAMWLIGEILTFAYILPKRDYPLLLNYSLNIVCLAIVVRYKFK